MLSVIFLELIIDVYLDTLLIPPEPFHAPPLLASHSTFCIPCANPGLVTELRDVSVTAVSLGKAHAVALTSKGHVYTFGINNKGQCGRDYVAGATRESG